MQVLRYQMQYHNKRFMYKTNHGPRIRDICHVYGGCFS